MKYIVCQVQHDGEPFMNVPVVFPDLLVHAMVFAQMRALLEMQFFSNKKKTTVIALSGGEFSSMAFESHPMQTDPNEQAMCHGESTSLGVKSRGMEDDQLIRMTDYGSAMVV